MTEKNMKILPFETANVRDEVRRLAYCFNLASETYAKTDANTVILKGYELFEAITEDAAPAQLSDEESSYMRTKFLGIAAKIRGPHDFAWQPYAEGLMQIVGQLENSARDKGLGFSGKAP